MKFYLVQLTFFNLYIKIKKTYVVLYQSHEKKCNNYTQAA
jgi:hypothetical protein